MSELLNHVPISGTLRYREINLISIFILKSLPKLFHKVLRHSFFGSPSFNVFLIILIGKIIEFVDITQKRLPHS